MSDISQRLNQLSSSQRVLVALNEAVVKLAAVEQSKTEPIAIIGMSGRFPGSANDLEAFWQLLHDGKEAIAEVPKDRWDIDAYYDPNPGIPGKMYTRYGGFVEQVDQFDPQFFGIAPREAVSLDPQQRLLLEVSWEALENAGQIPDRLAGSQTGVFVGITFNDYRQLLIRSGALSQIDAYFNTGNPLNAAAGRLSYTLGLQGPSMAIDTACSSSLVAVHLACHSLRNGECRQALAGGVNLILSPENTVALSRAQLMAADGRCKTFDADADGMVRGEGCGIVVLKRLSDAIADGDHILALIRGSAVNQDGRSSGFTVPNGPAQQALIRSSLANAKVEPSQVNYVEAHGTGTSLGDPIEVRALGAVLSEGRSSTQPLMIGSVKTNIGHLESAAGIAGLIKVVLALQHEEIPPHLHFYKPNPHIPWNELPVVVPTKRTLWKSGERRRIAGVSSFGISGTNAHVLLEEAPSLEPVQAEVERPLHLLTLSAKTEEALKQLAARYENHLAANPALPLGDICFTANTGRSHFHHRLSVVAHRTAELSQKLGNLRAGKEATGVQPGKVSGTTQPQVAFLFTGQGSQYLGMGRELYETQPTFRAALDRCDQILRPYLEQPLLEVLYPEPGVNSPLDETAYTQPALFALEYALAELWQSWGITPDVVMGHSVGEYVAACVAGVFSLEDGLKLIAERARLMQALPQDGAMVSVFADADRVTAAIQPYAHKVAIAAFNGPKSIVISGVRQAVVSVVAALEADGIKTTKLKVSHAFHSPLMQPMLADFERVAGNVTYSQPRLGLISNVTGGMATTEIATPAYWCSHIRQPVRFAASIETLHQQGYEVFVEIGPKPTLLGIARHCLPEGVGVWLPSLRPGQEDWQQMLQSLGELYVRGVSVDWSGFDRDYHRSRLLLPTYPFQRSRYWVEPFASDVHQGVNLSLRNTKASHPLLGRRLRLPFSQEIRFESQFSPNSPPYLDDHRLYGTVVVPASSHISMVLSAVKEAFGSESCTLHELFFPQALALSDQTVQTVQLILVPQETGETTLQVVSLPEGEDANEATAWILHGTGKIRPASTDYQLALELVDLKALQARCSQVLSGSEFYADFWQAGYHLGPSFRWIGTIWRGEGEILCQMETPQLPDKANVYQLYAGLIDSSLQLLVVNQSKELLNSDYIYVPFTVGTMKFYGRPRPESQLWCHARVQEPEGSNKATLRGEIRLLDETGLAIAEFTGVQFRRANREALLRSLQKDVDDWLYEVTWQPQAREKSLVSKFQEGPSSWLIFTDQGGIGDKLVELLKQRGDRCVLVSADQAYGQSEAEHYQINPAEPQDFQRLLRESLGDNQPPYRGVVHLWSLEETPGQETSLTALQNAQLLGCGSVLHLVQALAQAGWSELPGLWLVTRETQSVGSAPTPLQVQQSTLWGLGRVIALEHTDLKCVLLDLEPSGDADEIQALFEELWFPDTENQVAYRQGVRHVARLVRHTSQDSKSQSQLQATASEPFQVKISSDGILENLSLLPITRQSPGPGEVEIQVRATGLNFRDVLNALGMLKEFYAEHLGISSATDIPLGGECAGKIVAVGENVSDFKVGDEVMAVLALGSLSNFVTVKAEFVVPKSEKLSFEEAATLPLVFLTAYYGLHHLAKIQPGDRVLIHAAAGGVGQAAVQIAQRAGAEIFATASPTKWEFLNSLGVEHVMNSRTLDFASEVMAFTEGQGVDIVFNSLNGEFIPKSLEVLRKGGRFVEIGKIGIWDERQVLQLRADVSYFYFDLVNLSKHNPGLIALMLRELMLQWQEGTLKPLPHKVFPIQEVVNAFRYMAQAKHIGKVVISQSEMATGVGSLDRKLVRGDSSYLIAGGLGALGLKVAHWMVEQGARHLVLTGRHGASGVAQEAVSQLEQAGAQVLVVKADVSNQEDVAWVLEAVKANMPPLRGLVHAAGVLDDGVLLQQNWECFTRVMAPKVEGTWNLHTLTQELPLDFFVCFSSAVSLLGSPGQGNYAAANAFMDALAHHRRGLGLPGLSINWGPWADAGMAARLGSHDQSRMANQGLGTIAPQQGLHVLGVLLGQSAAQVGVLPVNWSKFLQQFSVSGKAQFFDAFTPASEQPLEQRHEFLQQLEAAPVNERQALLVAHVRSQVAKVLGLSSPEQIELRQRLFDLGIDSLMAVELKNRLHTSLGRSLRSTLVFDYPTVEALVNYLAQEVLSIEFFEPSNVESHKNSESPDPASAKLKQLSESEAEALLLKELENLNY